MTSCALVGAEAADRYADALLRIPGMCVAAVVDPDAGRREQAAHRLGVEVQAASLVELLAEAPDCCSVVLVHGAADARLEVAAEAVGHGKHVLLELPPVAGADALAALGEQCASNGVCLTIGGTLRFLPSQQVLKQRLDSGKLGELGLLRAHRWHADAASGAGWQDLAAPYLDLANWLFEDCPERVYARTAGTDYAQIHLGFRAGGMALIDVSAGLPPGDGYRSVSVIGSTGAGYADDHHNRALLFGGGDPAARDPGEGNHDLTAELADFAAAIAEQRAPSVTAADAHDALLVAAAAAASAADGTVRERRGDRYE
jgi:predicted dehydrogenase